MGVRTHADQLRDEAIDNIKQALKCLQVLVVDQPDGWSGYDGFTEEYREKLMDLYRGVTDAFMDFC